MIFDLAEQGRITLLWVRHVLVFTGTLSTKTDRRGFLDQLLL